MCYLSPAVDIGIAAAAAGTTAAAGLPWQAECGGLMKLGNIYEDEDEQQADCSQEPYRSCHSHY